jgi:hypothetical protein
LSLTTDFKEKKNRSAIRSRLMSALAVVAFATPLWAADLTGTWSGEVKIPRGGGSLPLVAHLKQSGTAVTGYLEGTNGQPDGDIEQGSIDGNTVTFFVMVYLQEQPRRFKYSGTVSGDSIHFVIAPEEGPGPRFESVTTRVK